MHSSKKVIKASSIRIAPKLTPEISSGPTTERHGEKNPRAFGTTQGATSPAEPRQSDVENQAERISQEAYERGLAAGLKKGAAEQMQALTQHENALAGLIRELEKSRKEFLSRLEDDVLNLAFAIAEKILTHEIATDKEVVRKVLGGALSKMVDHEGMKIRVNPADYGYLKSIIEAPFPGLDEIKTVMLEEDASIGRGGVFIVSALGEVDARLDQQMSILKDALANR